MSRGWIYNLSLFACMMHVMYTCMFVCAYMCNCMSVFMDLCRVSDIRWRPCGMDAELGNTLAKCESMLHDFTISLAQSLQPLGKSFLRLNRALIVFIENVVAARWIYTQCAGNGQRAAGISRCLLVLFVISDLLLVELGSVLGGKEKSWLLRFGC